MTMMMILLILAINLGKQTMPRLHNGLQQKDSTLYLYFDEKDEKQIKRTNVNIFYARGETIQDRFYKGDIYYYNYFLHRNTPFSFVSSPHSTPFELTSDDLNKYQIWSIKDLENHINKLNNKSLYTTKGDEYFANLKDVYLVQVNHSIKKAKIVPVRFNLDLE